MCKKFGSSVHDSLSCNNSLPMWSIQETPHHSFSIQSYIHSLKHAPRCKHTNLSCHTPATFPVAIGKRLNRGFFRRGFCFDLYIWVTKKRSTRIMPRNAMIGKTPALSERPSVFEWVSQDNTPPAPSCIPLGMILSLSSILTIGSGWSKPIDKSFCCLNKFLQWVTHKLNVMWGGLIYCKSATIFNNVIY